MKNKISMFPYELIGRTRIFSTSFIGVVILFSSSFRNDTSNITLTLQLPVLTTSEVSSITSNTATCGGYISCDNGSKTIERGVCWSIDTMPSISDNKTTDGSGAGSFTSFITGLKSNTKYFVRAYATNNDGTGYGNVISFSTATTQQTVTDIDGNIYHTVTIGTQVWLVENLKATKYCNGDPIPNVSDDVQWSKLTTGACCDYANIPGNSKIFGKLYNWYAVNDSRKIAPKGWHIPTDAEWTVLTNYLGGESVAGGKLKEIGFTHWAYNNDGASNSVGFTALPGGTRSKEGKDGYIRYGGAWWCSPADSTDAQWARSIAYNYSNLTANINPKQNGLSVRCIRDN